MFTQRAETGHIHKNNMFDLRSSLVSHNMQVTTRFNRQ